MRSVGKTSDKERERERSWQVKRIIRRIKDEPRVGGGRLEVKGSHITIYTETQKEEKKTAKFGMKRMESSSSSFSFLLSSSFHSYPPSSG